jgi:hypothetical protein
MILSKGTLIVCTVRENRTIQRHWQLSSHKTQDEEKKSKKHRKQTKKISNTDTTKTGGDPGVREDTAQIRFVPTNVFTSTLVILYSMK